APELGGANDVAVAVQWNEAVLLAADPDGGYINGDGFGLTQTLANGAGGGVAPGVRMLFLRARRQVGDEIVRLRGAGQNFSVARIDHDDFGRLRATIDADDQISHNKILTE